MIEDISTIIGRLDALDAGPVEISYVERDGSVWAKIPTLDVRGEHTLSSLAGNAETADDAIRDLWDEMVSLPRGSALRIEIDDKPKRYVRWNGCAWRDVTEQFAPAPVAAEDELVS